MKDIIDFEKHILDAMALSNDIVCALRESKFRVTDGPLAMEYSSIVFSDFLLSYIDNVDIEYEVKKHMLDLSCKALVSQLCITQQADIEKNYKEKLNEMCLDWKQIIDEIVKGAKARSRVYINVKNQINSSEDILESAEKIKNNEFKIIFIGKNEDSDNEKSPPSTE